MRCDLIAIVMGDREPKKLVCRIEMVSTSPEATHPRLCYVTEKEEQRIELKLGKVNT